jgi:ATP-dependent DNA helicase RecQ
MTKNHDYDAAIDEAAAAQGGGSAGDPELFAMLKDLRKKVAKRLDLPPFVIFQDPSLADMSIQYPITIAELQNIQGVGQGKAMRYGKEFVELISKYVDENEIERPQDIVVKSVAQKSKNKVTIIQNIDRKVSLDIIAESLGLGMEDLLLRLKPCEFGHKN